MKAWYRYWFSPSPCFDLAIVRIIASATTLYYTRFFHNYYESIYDLATLPPENYNPTLLFRILHAPFGWGFGPDGAWIVRPDGDVVSVFFTICLIAGTLSLIGFLTRLSLATFAFTFVYVQSYVFSFNDFHHPEAVMAIALTAMVLSPAGRVLSVDALIRGRKENPLEVVDDLAGWPLKFTQWFFVLMYWSAVWSKLTIGGLDWANGFTLQFYLAQDGLRWGGNLALWLSQFHNFILIGQIGVLLFQGTFFLSVLFPVLRWIYVPAGIALHLFIYLTLQAPFFTWIALYSAMIPWSEIAKRLGGHQMYSLRN